MLFTNASIPAILIASLFVISGVKGFMGFNGFKNMLAARGLPFPFLLALISLSLKTFGGLSIAMDNSYSLAATRALIIFMIFATVLFHNFFSKPSELMNGLRNIAVIGGLLMLLRQKKNTAQYYDYKLGVGDL